MKHVYLLFTLVLLTNFSIIAQSETFSISSPPSSTPIQIVGDKIFWFHQSELTITDITTLEEEEKFIQSTDRHLKGLASCTHREGLVFFCADDSNVKSVYVNFEGEVMVSRHHDIPAHPVSVHSTVDGNIMVLFKLYDTCMYDYGENKYYVTIFSGDFLHRLVTYSVCDGLLTFCKAEMVDGRYTVFAKTRSLPTVEVFSWLPYTDEIECNQFDVGFYITDVLVEDEEWLISGVDQSDFTEKDVPVIAYVNANMNVYGKTKFEQLGLDITHKLNSCYLSAGPYNTYWLSTNDIDRGESYFVAHGFPNTERFSQLNQELDILQTFTFNDSNSAAKVICKQSDCFFTFWGWHCGHPYFKHTYIGDASLFNTIETDEEENEDVTNPYPQIIARPNPTTNYVNLKIPDGLTIEQLTLYSHKGIVTALNPKSTTIDLRQQAAGIYTLKAVDTKGRILTKKLVKH